MPLQTELTAYSAKINLPLLNSIVAFVLDTAEVTRAQSAELPVPDTAGRQYLPGAIRFSLSWRIVGTL